MFSTTEVVATSSAITTVPQPKFGGRGYRKICKLKAMGYLGDRVRWLLELRPDISQADLARSVGVSQQAIAKMVSEKNPQKQSKNVSKLARFFHVTVEQME